MVKIVTLVSQQNHRPRILYAGWLHWLKKNTLTLHTVWCHLAQILQSRLMNRLGGLGYASRISKVRVEVPTSLSFPPWQALVSQLCRDSERPSVGLEQWAGAAYGQPGCSWASEQTPRRPIMTSGATKP